MNPLVCFTTPVGGDVRAPYAARSNGMTASAEVIAGSSPGPGLASLRANEQSGTAAPPFPAQRGGNGGHGWVP
ncbi:hypothetical protein [Embleya sp. NPDC020886]|uniref:hypothetical protein n=1 Tax=Embleya sp. NPDC020886 TaxID=3363980 RepID=UPI0037898771